MFLKCDEFGCGNYVLMLWVGKFYMIGGVDVVWIDVYDYDLVGEINGFFDIVCDEKNG